EKMADQPLKRIASAGGSLLGGAGVAQARPAEEALRHEGAAEDLVVAEVAEPSEIGFWKLAVIRFLHHRTATVSMGILLFIILTAMIMPTFQGDLYRLQDYTHPYGSPFEFHSRTIGLAGATFSIPWTDHLLGTDALGRDEMARLVRGARVSLTVGLLAMLGYIIIGGILGALAGFYGGWIDNALMRLTDVIILLAAELGFLGYSVPPPEPSWGNLLSQYEEEIQLGKLWPLAFPAIALVTTALCINLIGDGIRDALDPRQR